MYCYVMKLAQQPDKQNFSATDISFSELKTIRDACKAHAKSGSAAAGKIAAEIETLLESAVI